MFSTRICRFLRILHWLTTRFGIIPARYDKTTKIFRHDPCLEWLVHLNYILGVSWAFLAFVIILKYNILKDVNRTNVTFAYWLVGILVLIIFLIPCFASHQVCYMTNGFTKFMEMIHRK